jgi:hypothetical protein
MTPTRTSTCSRDLSKRCLGSKAGMLVVTSCLALLLSCHEVGAVSRILAIRQKILLKSSFFCRGGAAKRRRSGEEEDPFLLLARAIQGRLNAEMEDSPPDLSDIVDAFSQLASSQQTFKGLDGAAHEAYQRTHAGDDVDLSVSGRARRSAARAAATADGLGACELCELLESPSLVDMESANGTLVGRQVLLNITAQASTISLNGKNNISVLVLYEPIYMGGAGILHGGIQVEDDNKNPVPSKGRLLIVVGDELRSNLIGSLEILNQPPKHVRLDSGLLSGEVASVQPSLFKAAGSLLETLGPILREHGNTTSAIHFVGRSIGGGVANLAAVMLHGSLPMPKTNKKTNKKQKKPKAKTSSTGPADEDIDALMNPTDSNVTVEVPLSGLGKDRTSSVSLGAPPSVSANVPSEFIISIMYGDDIVCRTSRASMDRLLKRSKKAINSKGWFGGKQLNLMTDAVSLTMSSLRSHAHGSEGEELRLAVPGRAYLLRPRRLGGASSIHEVGNRLKGGREALRAHILWQLDDVLLSKSLWKHHHLNSYIHGLDRAHLRGFTEDSDSED